MARRQMRGIPRLWFVVCVIASMLCLDAVNSITTYADPLGSIGGKVFYDPNHSGQLDPGEQIIVGARLQLATPTNQVLQETYSDANGDYLFQNIQPGVYRVRYLLSPPVGSGTITTVDITLAAGQHITFNITLMPDPSTLPHGTVNVHLWYDINHNGSQDQSEPDAPGASVITIIDESGGGRYGAPDHADASGNASVFIDKPGKYLLEGLWYLPGLTPASGIGGAARVTVELSKTIRVDLPLIGSSPEFTDWAIADGRFYTEANGHPPMSSPVGYALTNADGIAFWDAFQHIGKVDTLGYPSSRRFTLNGFVVQLTQGGLLQWQPERHEVVLANIFELLEQAGMDDSLYRQGIPHAIQDDGSGGDLQRAKEIRLGWLTNEAIKAKYLANPNPAALPSWSLEQSIELYGLPMSKPERFGPFISQRFQRVSFQLWGEDVPGMPVKGTVVRILGGDLLKSAGLVPKQAATPQDPIVPYP